jgi:transposase
LKRVVANRNSPQKHVRRAKIILLTADGCGTAEIMQATGKAKTVIWRWQERFRDHGAAVLNHVSGAIQPHLGVAG